MNKLSKRLAKIADYIGDENHYVDIGCDHALLDIYIARKYPNNVIIASDINENALNNARKNIKKYNLENRIQTIKSKGLENIDTKDLNTIVISGMGSHTIVGILYKTPKKLKPIWTIIIQSNNDLDFLRYKVTKLGYYIETESLVKDSSIIYNVIVFKKGYRFYTKKDYYFGPIDLTSDFLFQEKYRKELAKLEKFYPFIPKNHFHHKRLTRWKIKMIRKKLHIDKGV